MLQRISKILGLDLRYDNPVDDWDTKSIGKLIAPETFSSKKAFKLVNLVPELFFPVDFYADRISKLRFFIASQSGKEVKNTELNRLIENINPIWTFSDLAYQYVFSLLADGNAISYFQKPVNYDVLNVDSITRWDVLNPELISIDEYSGLSVLDATNVSDFIRAAKYNDSNRSRLLEKDQLFIQNYSAKKRNDSYVFSESALTPANKSIDILLAVYSARYNVYANNGAAGYLAQKTKNSTGNGIESFIDDGQNKRDEILNDINSRKGLTGKRHLWGISGVPIEFVKTIATISELMPFEETLEDAIKIAAIFQIPPVLVPRKDQSTYDNQANAEKNVWDNGLLSMANTFCQNFTKMVGLDKAKYKLMFDKSMIPALAENEIEREDLFSKRLDNYIKLNSISTTETDNTKILNKIISDYGRE